MRSLLFSTLLPTLCLLPLVPTSAIDNSVPTLSAAQLSSLRSGERLTAFFPSPSEISLLPETVFSRSFTESLTALDPRIGVEALTLLVLPESVLNRPDFTLRVYNILRSISTMQGIEYYSASRGRMREFYLESYTVDGPDNRRRIVDQPVSTVPPNDRIYAFQRDSSFGRNTYALDYRYQSGQVGLSMINLTRMSYGIVPLVGEENLEIHLAVIPTSEGLLFYGVCGVRVFGLFGMQDRVQSSFQNRIDAIYSWFAARVQQEFGL